MNEWTKDYKGRWIVPKPERHWLSEKEVRDYAEKEHGFHYHRAECEKEDEPRKVTFVRDEELRSVIDKGCFAIETWLDFYSEQGMVSVTTYLVRCGEDWLEQKNAVQVGRTRFLEIGDMASFRYFLYLDSYKAKKSLGIDTMGSDIYDEVVEYRNGREPADLFELKRLAERMSSESIDNLNKATAEDLKRQVEEIKASMEKDGKVLNDDAFFGGVESSSSEKDDFLSVAPTETAQEEKPADDTFAKSVDGKHRKSFLNILKEKKARGEKV